MLNNKPLIIIATIILVLSIGIRLLLCFQRPRL